MGQQDSMTLEMTLASQAALVMEQPSVVHLCEGKIFLLFLDRPDREAFVSREVSVGSNSSKPSVQYLAGLFSLNCVLVLTEPSYASVFAAAADESDG
jgi:hypothetical protein